MKVFKLSRFGNGVLQYLDAFLVTLTFHFCRRRLSLILLFLKQIASKQRSRLQFFHAWIIFSRVECSSIMSRSASSAQWSKSLKSFISFQLSLSPGLFQVHFFWKKTPSNRIRTSDLRISAIFLYSPPLYQLSYRGIVNRLLIFNIYKGHFEVHVEIINRFRYIFLYNKMVISGP